MSTHRVSRFSYVIGLLPRVAAAALVVAGGCSVTYPKGWQTLHPSSDVIQATRWKMYGVAPTSWDLPDGGQVRIDLKKYLLTPSRGATTAQPELIFTAAYPDHPELRVHCQTEPSGPPAPESRFGCWSDADNGQSLQFWLAPGKDCVAWDIPRILTRPECWQGELTVDEHRIALQRGYVTRSGAPVDYIGWLDSEGEVLLGACFVLESQIRLYEPQTPAALSDRLRKQLILMTVALSYWSHASQL